MSKLSFASKLAHLSKEDREDAEAMLLGLGMKYYGLISHSKCVDMYTLKQIYVKSIASKGEQESMMKTKETLDAVKAATSRGLPITNETMLETLHQKQADISRANPLAHLSAMDPSNAHSRLFIDQGLPVRRRLAAKVFADYSPGARGMRVKDIPKALDELGIPLEESLVSAFSGKHQSMIIDIERWHTVVKRCCAREESKRDTFIPAEIGMSAKSASETKSTSTIENTKLGQDVPLKGSSKRDDFKAVLARHRRQALSNRATSRSIVDQFLRGPIGTELYTNPHPWWDKEDISYNAELQRRYEGDDDSDAESLDAHDERMFLNTLGINVPKTKPYKESMSILDQIDSLSHPAINGAGLQGVKDKFAKHDKIALQRQQVRQAERDAGSAEGWERKKGGWVADFGFQKKTSNEVNGKQATETRKSDGDEDEHSLATSATDTTAPQMLSKRGVLSADTVEMLTNRIKLASAEALALRDRGTNKTGEDASAMHSQVSDDNAIVDSAGDVEDDLDGANVEGSQIDESFNSEEGFDSVDNSSVEENNELQDNSPISPMTKEQSEANDLLSKKLHEMDNENYAKDDVAVKANHPWLPASPA